MKLKRALKIALFSGFFCSAILGSWAFWLEPASLKTGNYEIALSSWPRACDGIRVAILADLHVGSPYNGADKLNRIVELALSAKPDLILLAGDYVVHRVVGGTFISPEVIARGLRGLAAPLGVFAVLGNHDHWLNARQIAAAFSAVGVKILEDDTVALTSGHCSFWLVGLSDFWEGARQYKAAFAKAPAGATVLAFTHNPDAFPSLPAVATIVFAGHTHGGQVYLPGLGRLIVPSRYGDRYAVGHIVERGKHMFVSPGIGTSILPVRFMVPPEISVVVLRARDSLRRNPAKAA